MSEPASGFFISSDACMLPRSCGPLARPTSPQGRHRRLRPLCDKFFVQPATAVVAPPNLSAHQPAGNAASRHDDPPKMPGGWFGIAPLQSKLADVDGCKSDRCHAHHLAQAARRRHRPQRASRRPSSAFTIVAPAATARNNTDARNPVLDPRDTGIIANRAATVVNEIRVLTRVIIIGRHCDIFAPCFTMTHERPRGAEYPGGIVDAP